MTTGVYGIFESQTNVCLYIGQSIDIEARWYRHQYLLRKGKHHTHKFQEYFDLGNKSIEHRLLEKCAGSVIHLKEIEWSDKLQPLFWGRKPGKTWRWSDIAPDVLDRISQERHAKAAKDFEEIDSLWGDKVVALYKEGFTAETIPAKIPVPYSYVLRIMKHRGVEFRTRQETVGFEYSRNRTLDQLKEELIELRAQDKSWPQIAKMWNCGDTTIKDLAKRLGFHEAAKPFALAGLSDEEIKSRIEALQALHYSAQKVADELGIARSALFRKLHKFYPERFER